MHESSLVESMLEQVQSIAARHLGLAVAAGPGVDRATIARQVTRIELELGPLSGVEPELVGLAFERLASEAGFCNARLELVHVPLRLRCDDCGRESVPTEIQFRCASCESKRVTVLQGDACILKQVELETEEVER